MTTAPVPIRRFLKCRRCRRPMRAPGYKIWLPDDTLFPGLPGTQGGWCCLACGRAAGLRLRAA